MKDNKIKYSDCPNSEYQINKLRQDNKHLIKALQRIKDTYDNVEDLAGVIAKETLSKINLVK